MLAHAVDYASGARCGLRFAVDYACWRMLWITLRCGLRMLAHAVDYASHLWISQPFGLGRIYPRVVLAVDFPTLRARVQK